MTSSYQICTRCIMDTSDPVIEFDSDGVCNHCKHQFELEKTELIPAHLRDATLSKLVNRIKAHGRGREYDCLIGVSGGVDSSYVACKVKELGLRPLAVHFDNGWNSTLAVTNIHHLLKKLDIDLFTYVVDWEEFRELQLAFLRSSTPDCEIPTDHAISAVLWQTALKHHIRYVISGSNLATEGILPSEWSRGYRDWKYIRSIHRRFSNVPLKTFPHFTLAQLVAYKTVLRQKTVPLLNYLSYVKSEAMDVLQRQFGWVYYGGKHYESIYTRFYQGYILPTKFGFDKRRAHLSSLICSGEITRDEALQEISTNPYPPELFDEDREFVIKKLGLTDGEFDSIMAVPAKTFWDYPSYEKGAVYRTLCFFYRFPRTVRAAMHGNVDRPAVSVSETSPGSSVTTNRVGNTETRSEAA